jgi:hypothetical protein
MDLNDITNKASSVLNAQVAKVLGKGITFFRKIDAMSYAEMLDRAFGGNLPSLEHDFEVWMGVDENMMKDNTGILYPESLKDKVFKRKYLYAVTDVSIPKLGFYFSNVPAGSGFIQAALEEGAPITIVFWDSASCQECRILEANYRAQFSKYGTLRLGYKANWMVIRIGEIIITLENGAFTRPLPTSVSSASNGLTKYAITFAYEDYSVGYYERDVAVDYSIHDSNFEDLVIL